MDGVTVTKKYNNIMTKRIEYIDAIRGLTMLLVVITHIEVFCFGNRVPSFSMFFVDFIMPLFFFISGWVLYKDDVSWTVPKTIHFLQKKFLVQIIPTVFFLTIFLSSIGSITDYPWYLDKGKNGYWFTYVLFIYFIFYASTRCLLNKLNVKYTIIIQLLLSFFIYFLATEKVETIINSPILYGTLSVYYWRFFPFFIMGTIVKKNYDCFNKIMDNQWVLSTVIITFLILEIHHFELLAWNKTLYFFLSAISGVCLVFTFFRKNEKLFTSDKPLGRIMQFVGRRTLDVYLIHYLFLPRHFNFIGDYFKENVNMSIEFFVAMIFAVVVIAFSLLSGKILRMSPLFEKYLFGVRKK